MAVGTTFGAISRTNPSVAFDPSFSSALNRFSDRGRRYVGAHITSIISDSSCHEAEVSIVVQSAGKNRISDSCATVCERG